MNKLNKPQNAESNTQNNENTEVNQVNEVRQQVTETLNVNNEGINSAKNNIQKNRGSVNTNLEGTTNNNSGNEVLNPSDLDKDTVNFLRQLLPYERLIRPDDPACLAINTLLKSRFSRAEDKSRLLIYLKTEGGAAEPNFKLINKEIQIMNDENSSSNMELAEAEPNFKLINKEIHIMNDENSSSNMELVEKVSADTLQSLDVTLDDEAEHIREKLDLNKSLHSLNNKENTSMQNQLERLKEIKVAKREIANAQNSLKSDKRFMSSRQILGLMLVYLNKDDRNYDIEALANESRQRINTEESAMINREHGLLKFGKRVFSVDLASTLKSMAKEGHFRDLGENGPKILAQLAKPFMMGRGSYIRVKNWFDNIELDDSKKINTILPALITELELANQKGFLMRNNKTRNLIQNLYRIRDEHIRNAVFTEISDPQLRMEEYLKRINAADIDLSALSESSFLNPRKYTSVRRKSLTKTAGITALGGAALLGAAPYILGGAALAGSIKYRKPLATGGRHIKAASKFGINATKFTYNNALKPTGKLVKGSAKLGLNTAKRTARAWVETMKGIMDPLGLVGQHNIFGRVGNVAKIAIGK